MSTATSCTTSLPDSEKQGTLLKFRNVFALRSSNRAQASVLHSVGVSSSAIAKRLQNRRSRYFQVFNNVPYFRSLVLLAPRGCAILQEIQKVGMGFPFPAPRESRSPRALLLT